MTWESIVDGTKTMTRRDWKPQYVKQWHKGDVFMPVSRLRVKEYEVDAPRVLTADPYWQLLKDMPDVDFEREGGTSHWKDKAEYIEVMGGESKGYYVIEFEKVTP